jgi:serine/threonine-protein kinase RsbW
MAKKKKQKSDKTPFLIHDISSEISYLKMTDKVDANAHSETLNRCLTELLVNGKKQIIFDMENVDFPNGSFIAMLIGRTAEARRREAEIYLLNVTEAAKSNLSIFTPITYLALTTVELLISEGLISSSSALSEPYEDFEIGKPVKLQIDAKVDVLGEVNQFIAELAGKVGLEHLDISKLKIATYEACMNVVEHGYEFEPGHTLEVEVLWEKDRFQVTVIDHGKSFNFYDIKPYDVQAAYNEERRGGFGLYIIQKSVDEVQYEPDPDKGNRLILIKRL